MARRKLQRQCLGPAEQESLLFEWDNFFRIQYPFNGYIAS
jgi:hypothetical protein